MAPAYRMASSHEGIISPTCRMGTNAEHVFAGDASAPALLAVSMCAHLGLTRSSAELLLYYPLRHSMPDGIAWLESGKYERAAQLRVFAV